MIPVNGNGQEGGAVLVEKEIIAPGTYFYRDEATGQPHKLHVTPELTAYWHDQGNKMLGQGLTVPVPREHDFSAHPMTPADKLDRNAGWIKEFRRKDVKDEAGKVLRKDALFGLLDIQDEEVAKKLPRTIRWTSPWINSFVDGKGQHWNNVISHLALTTRPRVVEQQPFPSVAAALSTATEVSLAAPDHFWSEKGLCLSRAGLLYGSAKANRWRPRFPAALSMWTGAALAAPDFAKPDKAAMDDDEKESFDAVGTDDEEGGDDLDLGGLANPLADANGDVAMEELLCDLLQALGVPMPDESNEAEFKRHLYEAAMSKIKELTSKGMGNGQQPPPDTNAPNQNKPPNQQPHASQPKDNPLIPQVKQEQQPLYMGMNAMPLSLDDINRIEDSTMRTVALSMYTENEKLRAALEANSRATNALRDAELQKATKARANRIKMLGRLSPKVAPQLDQMAGLQAMALSMGDDGTIVDPMKATLDMLEQGLADLPRLMTADHTALSAVAHPTDADALSAEGEKELVDNFSRMMGGVAEAAAK